MGVKYFRWYALALLVSLAALVFVILQNAPAPATSTALAVETTPAADIKRIGTIEIAPAKVRVYKPDAKARLKLPDPIKTDPWLHVTASTTVRQSDRPQTITAVLDEKTGETKTYVKAEPLPWLAIDPHGEIGLYAGLKNGERTARLEARQGLLQIKAAHLGAIAAIDQPFAGPHRPDYFVGVGVWVRW